MFKTVNSDAGDNPIKLSYTNNIEDSRKSSKFILPRTVSNDKV